MGINSPHFFSWRADKVTHNLLHSLHRGRNVDVDGNALAFALYKQAGYDVRQLPTVMVEVLKEISSLGFTIQIIFDNFASRPHTKRDSIKRRKAAALEAVHASYTKLKLLAMIRSNNNVTDEDATKMQAAALKMSNLVKKKLSLPTGFDDTVRQKIIALNGNTLHHTGGSILPDVIVAKHEADHLISKRFIEGASSFIYGVDSDYYALIGSSALLISNYKSKISKSKNADQSFTISGCSNKTRSYCIEKFLPQTISFSELQHEIFDNSNIMIRGLAAVAIGCDVFGGIKNVGPAKFKQLLNTPHNNQSPTYELLVQKLQSKTSLTEYEIETYVHSFLGATATDVEDSSYVRVWDGYSLPNNLSRYLNLFVNPKDQFGNDYDYLEPVYECRGFAGVQPHLCLSSVPSNSCEQCKAVFCECCLVYDAVKDNKTDVCYADINRLLCVDCYKLERVEAQVDDDEMRYADIPSYDEMLLYLRHHANVNVLDDLSIIETMQLYLHYRDDDCIITTVRQASESVPFPLYPATKMDEYLSTCTLFAFKDGLSIIDHSVVPTDQVYNALQLINNLCKYETNLDGHHIVDVHNNIISTEYLFIPTSIHKMILKSRIRSSHRLFKRCMRHSCDPNCPSMIYGSFGYLNIEGKGAFILSNYVYASYEKKYYSCNAVFTSDEVVCCRCDCPVGAKGVGRVLCVHIMPLLMKFFFLVVEDNLIENILVEFTRRYADERLEDVFKSEGKYDDVRDILLQLSSLDNRKKVDKNATHDIQDILSSYKVGTEKEKRNLPGLRRDDVLRPLKDINFISNQSSTLRSMRSFLKVKNILATDPFFAKFGFTAEDEDDDITPPNYYRISNMIYALERIVNPTVTEKECWEGTVGCQLLKLRSEKDIFSAVENRRYLMDVEECYNNLKDALTRVNKRCKRNKWMLTSKPPVNSEVAAIPTTKDDSSHSSRSPSPKKKRYRSKYQLPTRMYTRATKPPPKTANERNASRKKPRMRRRCIFPNCDYTDVNEKYIRMNVHMMNVPKPQLKPQPCHDTAPLKQLDRYYKKKLYHNEFINRLGFNSTEQLGNNKTDNRICTQHKLEKKIVTKSIKRRDGDVTFRYEFLIPVAAGLRRDCSTTKRAPSSLVQRAHLKQMKRARIEEISAAEKSESKIIRDTVSNLHDTQDLVVQMVDDDINKSADCVDDLHPEIAALYGFDKIPKPKVVVPRKGRAKGLVRVIRDKNKKKHSYKYNTDDKPVFNPSTTTARDIKYNTGASSYYHLLIVIIIISDGDIDIICNKTTVLTWLEEWVYLLEFMYHKRHLRNDQYRQTFRIANANLSAILFKRKMNVLLEQRKKWGRFVSFHEDIQLRDHKWDNWYSGKRVVFWDDTNVPLYFKPSNAELQRITYSSYYKENCFKGGVHLQLCGWIGVAPLWTGAISDSLYMEKNGIFNEQDEFANIDLVNGKKVPFTVILDKGYRLTSTAWRAGKQEVLQPVFMCSDRVFSSVDTLHSASVASDRSGNERAVRLAKQSNFIVKGIRGRTDTDMVNDIWEGWSFLANFLYKPVH